MTKHTHLQTLAEQLSNKGHGSAPFHYTNAPDQLSKMTGSTDIPMNMIVDERPIQLLAYQIHLERGGSPLDNWLEAERDVNNNN